MSITYKHIFFIGIGGIAMSNLAKYCLSRHIKVSGYDRAKTHIAESLEKKGVHIVYDDSNKYLSKDVDLVVYTPAVEKTNPLFAFFEARKIPVIKRSDLLQEITSNTYNISIAGTHGKTTTTGMVAHMLANTKEQFSAFVGGVLSNYKTNFIEQGDNPKTTITEADEFDRSFLKLKPNIAVVTSIEEDHMDIYQSHDDLVESFAGFVNNTNDEGTIIINQQAIENTDIQQRILHSKNQIISYSFSNTASDVYAKNVRKEGEYMLFDISYHNAEIKTIQLFMKGDYNIENALSCFIIGKILNIEEQSIRKSLKTYKGVYRRFEYIVENDKHIFIDDYAHHPSELDSFISSVKNIYKDKKITAIFQPHLYTRTRDFYADFAKSLSLTDEVILLPIYPAREKPIKRISSDIIANEIKDTICQLLTKQETLTYISKHKDDMEIILTVGAGDIDLMVQPIKHILIA